jgi:acyl-CoA thioester hydrolase
LSASKRKTKDDRYSKMNSKPLPDTRDAYPHLRRIETRWMDNDAYGHVNNAVYFSWFDTAISRYMLDEGVLDRQAGPICVMVETACNYFKPIAYPDDVTCGLRLAHIGTSSSRVETGVFRNDDAETAARGHFVYVCCDISTLQPVPTPPNMRRAFEKLRP